MKDSDTSRFAAIVEYEGTKYCGWQVQPNGIAVQQKIQESLEQLYKVPVSIVGSGRTDAGVHSRGQVFHFDAPSSYPPKTVLQAVNHFLPPDIRLIEVIKTGSDFHARFNAVGKEYSYRLYNSRIRPVFGRRFLWHINDELNIEAMQEAALLFIGKHDFRNLATESKDKPNCVREIRHIRILSQLPIIDLRLCADGFLYNLVRAIVGCLVAVGRTKLGKNEISNILASRTRPTLPPLAPPKGLTLEWVEYGNYSGITRKPVDDQTFRTF